MPDSCPHRLPSDVHLLLRADAEQLWLRREVIPVLRELEAREQPAEDDVCAALAYLEAMWSEAKIRARATDAARGELRRAAAAGRDGGEDGDGRDDGADGGDRLRGDASRYHTAVRLLRELLSARVSTLVQGTAERVSGLERPQSLLAEAPAAENCAPRAA